MRLNDVPLADRLNALHRIMAATSLTAEEAQNFMSLVIDPGDAGGRITT